MWDGRKCLTSQSIAESGRKGADWERRGGKIVKWKAFCGYLRGANFYLNEMLTDFD